MGQGDSAVVRRARDERLGRTVAVKILVPELARDAEFRTRLFSESRAAAEIGHPGILPVYAAGDADGTVYVAMHYVRGSDGRSLLNRLGPPPLVYVWQIIAQVAAALDAAHARGLIHRDVKPANMLLEARDSVSAPPDWADYDLEHVYLSDFGMSRDAPPEEIIATGQYAGSLDYLAPEQVQERVVDGRADVYSLGCAAFELLCGAPPFGQDQGLTVLYAQLYAPPPAVTALRPGLPAALDVVLATALAKDPGDRYATCGQFAVALRAALGASGASGGTAAPGLTAASGPPVVPGMPAVPSGPADGWDPVDDEDDEDPADGGGGRNRLRSAVFMLILAVVVAIVAAVTTNLVLSHRHTTATSSPAASTAPPSSPAPAPAPASASASASPASASPAAAAVPSQQASAVNKLLSSSAAARTTLQHAVSHAGSCTNVSGAVSQIQGVVSQRSAEYSQAVALSTSGLVHGATLKSDLLTVLRYSLSADKDYLGWAQQQLKPGCAAGTPPIAFTAADQQAGVAKVAFLQIWNPIAAKYGLPQKSATSI
ncbi:MAG: serine/threonine-protein kinase [Streptosporangiaceae bacterium]